MTIMTRPSSRDKLVGQKILVIGGTSGIGFGCALTLLEHGAHVTVISSQQAHVDAAVARLNAHIASVDPSLPPARGHAGDVRDEAALTALLLALAPLDHILFTPVDRVVRGRLATADLADAAQLFGVKFWGGVVVAKAIAAHPGVIVRPGGSLTLTAGAAALRGSRGMAVGGALNGGIMALTRGLAAELAGEGEGEGEDRRRGVRVNCVVPGLCRTELWDRMGHAREAQDEVMERGARELSVGFVARPEDVAEAYLFFVRADYANGTTVVIDGGGHI